MVYFFVITDKLVKSYHEMEADLQTLMKDFSDFKKYILKVFASSIEANQSNHLRDTKYLHNIVSDLQNVIKRKNQIINLLSNDMKNLKDQLNVNGNNTGKSVSCISHKNYIHKATENSNCGIETFNRFTPLAPDVYMHTPNADDTGENDVRGK